MGKYVAASRAAVNAPLTASDKLWKASSFVIAVFFVFAAAVQYNDPDPFLWMAVYSIPALSSFSITFIPMRFLIEYSRVLSIVLVLYIVACFALGVALVVSSNQLAGAGSPLDIEEGRELCGLLITSLWSFLTVLMLGKKRYTTFVHEAVSNCSLAVMATGAVVFALIPPLLWSVCFVDSLATRLSYCGRLHNCGLPKDLTAGANTSIS